MGSWQGYALGTRLRKVFEAHEQLEHFRPLLLVLSPFKRHGRLPHVNFQVSQGLSGICRVSRGPLSGVLCRPKRSERLGDQALRRGTSALFFFDIFVMLAMQTSVPSYALQSSLGNGALLAKGPGPRVLLTGVTYKAIIDISIS